MFMYIDHSSIRNGLVAIVASSIGQTAGNRIVRNNFTDLDHGRASIRILAFLTVLAGSCVVKIGSELLKNQPEIDDEEETDDE